MIPEHDFEWPENATNGVYIKPAGSQKTDPFSEQDDDDRKEKDEQDENQNARILSGAWRPVFGL